MENSIINNIMYIMKRTWQMDKGLLLAMFFQIPTTVLMPLLLVHLSKCVVGLVAAQSSTAGLIRQVLLVSAALLLLRLGDKYLSTKIRWRSYGNRFKYMDLYYQKVMEMDYELLEASSTQDRIQRALQAILGDEGGTQQIFMQVVSILSNFIGLVTYSVILLSFNPGIMLMLFFMAVLNYFFSRKSNLWQHKNKSRWIPLDRKLDYIKRISGDLSMAKDIRIFGMLGWLDDLFGRFLSERIGWWKKAEGYGFRLDLLIIAMNLVRDGVAYGTLLYSVSAGTLSVVDFVWYFNIIAQYSAWLMGIVGAYSTLQKTSLSICDLRAFLEMEGRFNHGEGIPLPGGTPKIEFRNVSFQYPGSNQFILKDLNISIEKGEKAALVGLNGAGKTTLVKLLCGLYMPTSGEIYINGKRMQNYNIEDYYSILSIVFQDILLMPVSVVKNIAMCEEREIDRERMEGVLRSSGLYGKVASLPHRENTLLCKDIHAGATDFSGGEKQKLALARALYKKGFVMVLDEPTAALDPIMENEIYLKYNQLTKDTTSVFISHRLSSTRFCDRIFLLKDGGIIEQGTHDDLMGKQGEYARLFAMQSSYYKEEVAE